MRSIVRFEISMKPPLKTYSHQQSEDSWVDGGKLLKSPQVLGCGMVQHSMRGKRKLKVRFMVYFLNFAFFFCLKKL